MPDFLMSYYPQSTGYINLFTVQVPFQWRGTCTELYYNKTMSYG